MGLIELIAVVLGWLLLGILAAVGFGCLVAPEEKPGAAGKTSPAKSAGAPPARAPRRVPPAKRVATCPRRVASSAAAR